MDPALVVAIVAGVFSLLGLIGRLLYGVVRYRAEVRRAELSQRGLSERVGLLPPGSRLSERADGSVEIRIGDAVPRETR
jgi:hypothetical protein